MLNLGMALKAAIQHGVNSLSYWRMARTPVTQQAMSNTWLKDQGLLSVKDLWLKGIRPDIENFVVRANLLNRTLRTRTVGGVGDKP